MKVHRSIESLDISRSVVTTGSFDGVHLGHMAIIRRLIRRAKELNACSVLITFWPHPRKVLYPKTAGRDLLMIASQNEKVELLGQSGLDHLVILEFTLEFSKTKSSDFIKNILVDRLNACHVIIGFNHHFGHKREGDLNELLYLGKNLGFSVEEIPEQEIHNETVSSTRIRKAISDGDLMRANAYLDYPWSISSESEIETDPDCERPVLNILPEGENKLLPPPGIYAAYVVLKNQDKREKAVFIISQGKGYNCRAFPVFCKQFDYKGPVVIQLYKNIGFFYPDLDDCHTIAGYVEDVQELIY